MIDTVKSYKLPITIPELLNNQLFDFNKNVNETGEINNRNQSAEYKNIRITINKERKVRKLKGSLHKFWNNGEHNYNDFSYADLVKAIINLADKIQIKPKDCKLNHIEFAVNLRTDFDPSDLIKDLVHHNGVPFNPMPDGNGKCCRHSQYSIKIYNKGLQYHLPYYVLRIEIKVNTMNYLLSKNILIRTLDDLMDLTKLRLLGKNLIERFNEILFYDSTIELEGLTKDELLILSNGRNPEYWAGLDKNKTDQFRRCYKKLYSSSARRMWQQIVTPMIKDKLDELLSEEKLPMESPIESSIVDDNRPINNINTPNETIADISDGVPSGKTLSMSNALFDTNSLDGTLYDSDSSKETLIDKFSDSVLGESKSIDKTSQNGELSDSVLSHSKPLKKTKHKTTISDSDSQLNLF